MAVATDQAIVQDTVKVDQGPSRDSSPDPVFGLDINTKTHAIADLVAKANNLVSNAESYHIYDQMCDYFRTIRDLGGVYRTLALLDRDRVEDLHVAVVREIINVEKDMDAIQDRVATTRGNSPIKEYFWQIGLRHVRLNDLKEVLRDGLGIGKNYFA